MRRNGVAIRTNHIVAVALLLLAIPAGLFFYFQGVEKQNYLTSRNLRILGAQSGQLALRIENYTSNVLGNLVRSAAQDPKMEFSPERFAESLKGTFLLASSLKLDGNIDLTPDSSQTTVVTLEPKQEKEAYQLAFDFEGPIEKTGYTVKFRAVIRMDQLIISIDRGVFDDLLIVKREGDDNSVIFQQAASGPKLTRLGTVSDIDGKKIAFTEVMRSNGISYAELGGVKYRLFVQPVRLSLSTGSLKKNSRIKADSDWSLCGLVRADRFRSESMAISDSLLLLFLLAFAMVMGAWPLLKLWSHGPTDRLGRADVIFVSVSVLMITGLLTFFILDLYAYLRLEKKLDQQLEQFAESVTNDFVGELGQLCQLLDRIMPFKGSSDKEPNKTSILSSESSLLHENDPYIETIILVGTGEDKKTDGMQFQKWTIDRTKTALIDVKERAYFRNIKECRGWTKSFEKDRQFTFILEPVLSLNTGEPQAVLSMPGRANQGPPECPPAYVAAATAKMISLRGKVLPPGYGFAVIDESGRVLFHSEQSRALVENFFEECEYNRELRALVYSRARGWVNASYSGRDHRMFARPFEDLPWTLVTFRDKEYARTANLELLSASGIIYIFYALVFLLPVVLLCLWHPEWMWPNEGRKADYLHLLSANLALIVVSLSELFFIFHHHVPSLAFVLPPFVVLLNCLRLTEGAHPSKWVQFPLFQLLMFLPVLQLALGLREFAEVRSRELLVETLLSMLFLYGVFLFAFYPPRFFLARALEFLNVQFKSKLSFSVAYVLAGVSLVAIMSVLPALVFFRSAHDSEMEVLVKHGQFNLSRSLVLSD